MRVDIPIMPQHARRQQTCAQHRHQRNRPQHVSRLRDPQRDDQRGLHACAQRDERRRGREAGAWVPALYVTLSTSALIRNANTKPSESLLLPESIIEQTRRELSSPTHLPVIAALHPRRQAQQRQDLRLHAQRHVEPGHDVVDPQRDAGGCPQQHHGRLQAVGRVPAVVDHDLRDELHGPADLWAVVRGWGVMFWEGGWGLSGWDVLRVNEVKKGGVRGWGWERCTAPMVPRTLAAMGTFMVGVVGEWLMEEGGCCVWC